MITLIAARARNGAIGKDNDIPWHIPEDLALFKRETLGGAIIMGRRTWDSLPFKPLKNRLNIVVSRDTSLHEHVVGSVAEAIALARAEGCFRIYGIGGQGIYEAMLPLADRLLLTEVDTVIEDADAFFPEIGEGWREEASMAVSQTPHLARVRELRR
ncbi:dihydrofolate reductase [Tropicibacter naphthalenivorans]|uniref:Dihydrofolate reductase n=1 Tax=Tropicibacter naphthalenivorans TaxID=441103 RepID=A0A0P1GAR7_9RHOB|nr:dihydrofolate reductase [Tropicibacter naphthalenivorans]CUH78590.1 Dihydrofolate reductase [Tropicibacter naphthalenivorans]SMC80985.1 dihydrofolate reductase [Tropicibacter naphthalenivorans]